MTDLSTLAPTVTAAETNRAVARRVFALAQEGLQTLIDGLAGAGGDRLDAAVDLLEGAAGRIIVTGMGKSGHIGRKIAATLASTGTPAFFVHPGEASHGDLGMITRSDVVLALSNSGETHELLDIIAYSKRFSIPLIAITRQDGSTLGESADVVLPLPKTAEACPNGLAPTTSTTLALAIGDALAVALLERRNFSAHDFKVFHPGGALGQKVRRVADLMHSGEALPLVTPETSLRAAILEMTSKRFGCTGVAGADGRLLGIVTDGDLRRHIENIDRPVAEVMTRNPVTIRPQALAAEAVAILNSKSITSLFVVESGVAVGLLHIHDCLRAGVH
ncbi:KpsF/GutQ [Elstera cyanobacteriorum]|uniref:KpsF/GutQ family sugar-phosphate isomerase n=1 Tax=Elstera cyanobacteriorum TaxID=2022747 RepID=A0A255XLJ4_9PROT|nr:KpsF/GutQ family sugar-phosphate isomerase [Elstera cyanobacteriorum]OYQ17837.1 KpsF/GutQ family sugar-phosphate isomerase [Elstera cyanobacteriorum]GFZ85625.1 KpsF/GutQ [Elstera cyanobacteriorum]